MIAETYVSGLNENISIYGLIAFMGKTNNKDNKPPLIKPEPKLKFSLKKYAYKKKEFKLGKVHNKVGKIIYSNKIQMKCSPVIKSINLDSKLKVCYLVQI